MKAYDERNRLFGTLTLDDLGVTQGQGQKCQISLYKPLYFLRVIFIFKCYTSNESL